MTSILEACTDLPERSFLSGDTLIREGADGGQLFILTRGEVVVRKGETDVARIREPGAIFGEISVLLDVPHSATVIATTDVTVRIADDAARFIEANPEIAVHTARTLAQRLTHATTYLADLKAQFSDETSHLSMMDSILDELLQQPHRKRADQDRSSDDPRL